MGKIYREGTIYRGEFYAGLPHGIGEIILGEAFLYRGQFSLGKANGCGVCINVKPLMNLMKKGCSLKLAYKLCKKELKKEMIAGMWQDGKLTNRIKHFNMFDDRKSLINEIKEHF